VEEQTRRRWFFALLAAVLSIASVRDAAADESAFDRHPRVASSVRKPAGVPSNYLLTPNGFFHPSCVIAIRSDEVWGSDLVIRGRDGSVHDRILPCPYARYSRQGTAIEMESASAPRGSASIHPGPSASTHHPHDTYDGWLVFYDYYGSVDTGSSISTEWAVPLPPSNVGAQDIAFFNDFETYDYILQPVLDFSELPNQWAIESENCCPSGNDLQSSLVAVSPGDIIQGLVTATDCDAAGVCTTWTVTTTDLTTGMSTVLNTNAAGEAAVELNPGVLETYDVTSCDMLPANGEITFENTLTNAAGVTVHKPYTFYNCADTDGCDAGIPASLPTDCGYGGFSSGSRFTLTFGTSPTPTPGIDAGEPGSDASTADSSVFDAGTGGGGDAGALSLDSGRSSNSPSGPPVGEDEGGSGDAKPDGFGSEGSSGCTVTPSVRPKDSRLEGLVGLLLVFSAFFRRRPSEETRPRG
jgi:hypothetical protein